MPPHASVLHPVALSLPVLPKPFAASASAVVQPPLRHLHHTPLFVLVFDFLNLDMEPSTPHSSHSHRAAADLFSPSAPLQESPGSISSLSTPESSPQASPQLNEEADLISHGYLFNQPLPGDIDYAFPEPNATSISALRIATLDEPDEFEFEDYDEVSYDDSHDELAGEQVGGGPYALRADIVPSPRANRAALKAQERRRESQRVDATAPANAQASTSHSQSADADAPSPKPRPVPRALKNGSKKKPLAETPSAPQFEAPPTLHYPAPPPTAFAQPTAQKPTAVTSMRRSETPSAPHQPAVQIAAAGSSTRQACSATSSTAVTSTRRSETPSAPHQTAVQIATAGSSMRQVRSATPFGPHHLALPQPMRASSLQAPATSVGTPDDYVPIPPENFSGTLMEFVVQAGFAPAGLPPPPPTWVAARRRSAHPPPFDAPDLEAKREMMDDPLANDQEGGVGGEGGIDDEDGVDANDNEDSIAALTCRRPTQGQRDAFDRAFADIRERIAQCASEARVSYGGVLKAFYQEEHTGLRPGKNSWNLYQRLNPSYSSATPVPALKADELSRAYKAFVEFAGGEEEAHKMLSLFFQLGGTTDDTIQARRRRFNAAVKTVEKLTEHLRLDDFFALTIIISAHTNEDEKLGEVIAIPRIEDALYEALATNVDEIIGFQKTAAATIIIKEQAKMRRDLKEEVASSAAASSRPAVPSSTARGSRSASSQLAAPPPPGPANMTPTPAC
ncbi:hypothetical protein B0H13DRAFT_2364566 [Mycena leptocephala]|nr:hypothetical protein B0H13DRAFT_2364566 [Mycena leptocephala]